MRLWRTIFAAQQHFICLKTKIAQERRLGQEKTVLLSTHILQEVEAMADRVILIAEGRMRFDGTPAELTAGGERLDERFYELTRAS